MNKIKYFQNIVKLHRRALIAKGLHPSTLTMWEQGKRFPSMANAKKVARITKTKIEDFPILIRNK